MLDERFARVAVVGTGMMGPGIALTLGRGGCQVALYGRTEARKERGVSTASLTKHHVISPAKNCMLTGCHPIP